jgi:ABC-type Fe3+-hydroxamate transport system substrate-binding protein
MKIKPLGMALASAVVVAGCGSASATVTKTQAASAPVAQAAPSTVTQVVKTVTQKAAPIQTVTASQSVQTHTKTAASASSSAGGKVVPSGLTGKTLDDAEDVLDRAGISYSTQGGDVILRSDWGVCATKPAAGSPVDGAVLLTVGHFSCGA